MALIFANHQQFESACRTFIEKHNQNDRKADDGSAYSSRVLSGWLWKNHPVYPSQGYMTRTDIRNDIAPRRPVDAAEAEELVEEDDPAASLPSAMASASMTVEWMIVYSKTYRIPQLCFNAHGPTGTPISLVDLLSTGIFQQRPRDRSAVHDDHLDIGCGHDQFDTMAQFPLLQRMSHPYPHTASPSFVETVWSIHPCHVQDTVAEVLSAGAGPSTDTSSARTAAGSMNGDIHRGTPQVAWLECWFMVTSTLMDLRR
ncbi:hypothetical protein NCC49_000965 [Naganishia albida]|nr:hypothetical protein NCC49_000965 [Naganishia albida]